MDIWFSGNILKRINSVKLEKESVPDFIRRSIERYVIELEGELSGK